jgi:hypothetical protein
MALLMALLLAPLFPALLPRRWAFLGFGLCALFWGLVWLSVHVEPFGASNYRGFDALILGGWALCGLVGFASVLARDLVRSLFIGKADIGVRPVRTGLWPLPIGALVAVFSMHWLSNRLAGAAPAWAVHVGVALAGLGAAGLLWRTRPGPGPLRDIWHTAMVGCVGVAVWVTVGAVEAHEQAAEARAAAGGAPYCMLTFAGRDHPRSASDVLELSRLVSRSGGRSSMDDAFWLIVETPEGLTAKRRRQRYGDPAFFEDRQIKDAPCAPAIGGNLP